MGADTGCVVVASGRERGFRKRVNRDAVFGEDRDMERLVQAAFAADPEIRLAVVAETRCIEGELWLHQHCIAAGLAGLDVAALAHVGNAVGEPFVPRQMFDHHRTRP
jgi:hypothetical protein